MKRTVFFSLAGFIGAAIFYSPYLGIDAETQYACPLCPHISAIWGTPIAHFVRYTQVFGILNAVTFSLLGLFVLYVAEKAKRLISG